MLAVSQPHWACPCSQHMCPPCPHCSGSRLLHWEPSEAGPGLYAPPRSRLLRCRHSGSPQRCRLGWAHILCPSQVQAAQVMRCLVRAVAATLSPPLSLPLGFLVVQLVRLLRLMLTVQPQEVLVSKEACLQFGR